jgi:organic radical activating enzyme
MDFKECGGAPENHIFFEWNITNYCNYDCYYCSVKKTMKTDPIKNHQTESIKLVIARLRLVKFPFTIDLAGGEPTLHKQFQFIVDELHKIDNCKTVSISTNFTTKFNVDMPKLDIGISYHPEYHKQYMKKLDIIRSVKNPTINVILTDNEEYWDRALEFIEAVGREYVLTILHPTDDNYKPKYDMDKFLKKFKKHFEYTKNNPINLFKYDDKLLTHDEILVNGLHELKGISCDSYYYSININGDFTRICTGEKLGLGLEGLDTTVICPHDICNCESRLLLNKRWL